MTDETKLAFGHPEERAATTEGADFLDRISLRNHVVEVEIGAFQAERGVTQRLSFDVVVEVYPLEEDAGDDVDRILSYDRVTEAIAFELAAERLNLLETLSERIADRILLEPQAARVFVRIQKLDRGSGELGVEIVRARGDASAAVAEGEKPHPRVVFLSQEAMVSENLGGWIEEMGADAPLIFCVGLPEVAAPQTGHPLTQRRVDLLAIEQNAWMLAARDRRCSVVGTWTELDWAMKNGQTCVWAPSKMVLDAVDGPKGSDAMALAQWLAEEMEACELVFIGADVSSVSTEGGKVPMRSQPVA